MNVFDGSARHILHWFRFHGSSKRTRVQTFGAFRGSCRGSIHVRGTSFPWVHLDGVAEHPPRSMAIPSHAIRDPSPLIHGAIAIHRRSRREGEGGPSTLFPLATAPVARGGGCGHGSGTTTRHRRIQARET